MAVLLELDAHLAEIFFLQPFVAIPDVVFRGLYRETAASQEE